MFRVLSCLNEAHDWRLVVLAAAVCLWGSLTTVGLFHRAGAKTGRERAVWLGLAGVAAGATVWATHFIAMLSYQPGVAVAYDIGLTALSLALGAGLTCTGLWIARTGTASASAAAGGCVIGAGIAAMHYTGMMALELPGRIVWERDLVAASLSPNTRLVALASAHFLTGYRIDIDAIGRLLHERGILFSLDAIQTLGAFPPADARRSSAKMSRGE